MSLRFFIDQCIPKYIIRELQNTGHEVLLLKDYIQPDSSDSAVISKSQELDSILVSLNGDFADIVTYPPLRYKGILSLQVRNHPEIIPLLVERLRNYLAANPEMDHYKGKLFLIEIHRIRIRE